MDLLYILFRRELSAVPRRRGFYWSRIGFATAAGLLVLTAFVVGTRLNLRTAGLPVFQSLTLLVLIFACILAPYTGSTSLLQERRHHLLGLLVITEMRSFHIIVGKLMASMGQTLLVMLAVLPLFLLCISLGGVSAMQIFLAHLLLLTTIFVGNALGLMIAASAVSESRAMTWLVITSLLLFVGLPLGVYAVATRYGFDGALLSLQVSPALAMIGISQNIEPTLIFHTCLVLCGLALCCLLVAFWLLPRFVVHHQEKRPVVTPFSHYVRRLPLLGRSVSLHRLIPNPLTWREYHFVHGDTGTIWLRFFAVLLICVSISVGILHYQGASDAIDMSILTLILLGHVSGLAALVVITVGVTRMFNQERQEGTIEPLLCTALSDRDIIHAKLQVLYLTLVPWLLTLVVSLLLSSFFIWMVKGDTSLPYLYGDAYLWNIISIFWWGTLIYGYCGFCLYTSLRYPSHPTLLAAIALFLWLTLGQVLLATLTIILTFTAALFGPLLFLAAPVLIGIVYRGKLQRDFRRYILTPSG